MLGHATQPARVLLVEDDEHDRVACQRALRANDGEFEIEVCERGEDALERLGQPDVEFDAVLCDYRLPGVNALQLHGQIRAAGYDVPFIMLTGVGTEKLAVDALHAGIDGYVIKESDNKYLEGLPEVVSRVVVARRDRIARRLAESQAHRHGAELALQNEQLRRTEQWLEQTKQRLQDLYDFAPVAYLSIDELDLIVECNRVACTMLGLERSSLIGASWKTFLNEEGRSVWSRHRRAVDEAGGRQSCELSITTSNATRRNGDGSTGEVRYVEVQSDKAAQEISRGLLRTVLVDVTARWQAEATARAAQTNLRIRDRAFAASSHGIIICDAQVADQPIVFCNPAFERITGYPADEVLGSNCRFLQGDERDQAVLGELRMALQSQRGGTFLLRNYKKDRTPFWNELTLAPVKDDNGVVTHFVGLQSDVTQRVEWEQRLQKYNDELESRVAGRTSELNAIVDELRDEVQRRQATESLLSESESRYRYLVEQTQEGFYRLDFVPPIVADQPEDGLIQQMYERGFIAECNDVYARTYGRASASEMVGTRLAVLHGGDDVPDNLAAMKAFVRDGLRHREVETIEVGEDGSTVHLSNNSVGIIVDGLFYSCWGTQRDITERKLAEHRLRDSEHRLRLVTDAIPAAIVYIDREQRYQFSNAKCEQVFGWNRDQAQGGHVRDILGETYAAVQPHVERAMSGAEVDDGHYVEVRAESRDLEFHFIPDVQDDGSTDGLYVMALDITERRQAEAELARHRDELAHMGRVQLAGEMAAGIAHELNQPLTAISLQSELCGVYLDRAADDPPVDLRESLSEIAAQTTRAGKIVNFLRNFINKAATHRSTVDLNDVVNSVVEHSAWKAAPEEAKVELEMNAAAPIVAIDTIQIEQVLLNLMTNARDALQACPPDERVIRVSTAIAGDDAVVSVSDNGPGIPSDQLDNVFESFQTTKEQGLGLGLAICRNIVAAHRGRIWPMCNADRGVTFHVSLPITHPDGASRNK